MPGIADAALGTLEASDLTAEILSRLKINDEAAFGALRSQHLNLDERNAYAYDTICGNRVLTKNLFDASDISQYDCNREAYHRYTASTRLVNTLIFSHRIGALMNSWPYMAL